MDANIDRLLQQLSRDIESDDTRGRARALYALRKHDAIEFAPLYAQVLQHSNPLVQRFGLEISVRNDMLPTLADLVDLAAAADYFLSASIGDPHDVVTLAVFALGENATITHLQATLDSTPDGDAAHILARLGVLEGTRVETAIVKALQHPHPATRLQAIKLSGKKRLAAARRTLLMLLGDSDLTSRMAVIQALGQLGDAQVAPNLLPYLNDADWQVRAAAAISLGRLRADKATRSMLTLVDDAPDATIRQQLIYALGVMDTPAARDYVWSLPRAEQPAIEAGDLEAFLDASARPGRVRDMARHPSPHVRAFAIDMLGEARYAANAADILLEAVLDVDAHVRSRAARSLGLQGMAADVLLTCLKDGAPQVRAEAALALARKGDAATVEAVLALCGDVVPVPHSDVLPGYSTVGDHAALALRDFDDPRAQQAHADWLASMRQRLQNG